MSKPWERNWKLDDADTRKAIADAEDGSTLFEQGMWCSDGDMSLAIAAPDMARALLAIRERVAEAGDALPRPRNADEMAAMEDSLVPIPTEMLRAAFAALKKAGAL